MQDYFTRRDREERLREKKYGKVRPIIHTDFKGYKIVAAGNRLFYSKSWKTFADFLKSYLALTLGKDWGQAELAKSYEDRHEIIKWYDSLRHFQRTGEKGVDGIFSGVPDGPSHAYYSLAYDLYILRHHAELRDELVRRLKNSDHFQGARYEVFVTATTIRAGFHIKFEDERDRNKTHPEFVATHIETGQMVSVEAKSRHRPGVLGFPGEAESPDKLKAGVRRIMNKAFTKITDHPYAVFIDLNLPPSSGKVFQKPWFQDVWNGVYEEGGPSPQNPDPYNLLVFSNHPDHYGKGGEPYPSGDTVWVLSRYPRVQAQHPQVLLTLGEAAHKYHAIPNEFPPDFNDGVRFSPES
jgi:hypothetical protein